MLVSDLTNHSVRSGVDLLLSLLTVPQKLHSRQYGIHRERERERGLLTVIGCMYNGT